MNVLIADDHVMFREGLISILSNEQDFNVVGEASSAEEAVEKALSLKPDIVLMDITLPDGMGFKAVKKILSKEPDMDIVMLTIHDTDEMLLEAIRAGAKGYILKNLPIAKLLVTLRSLKRGEPAISRTMTGAVLKELRRLGDQPGTLPKELENITKRELEVLELLGVRATNREIAEKLTLSENTVKNHVRSILEKLKLKNRAQVAHFARQFGIVKADNSSQLDS